MTTPGSAVGVFMGTDVGGGGMLGTEVGATGTVGTTGDGSVQPEKSRLNIRTENRNVFPERDECIA
jgi:hypothetical protein